MRRRVRFLSIIMGIFCLFAMLKPGYSHDRFYLGLPFSPLFDYEGPSDRRTETPTGITRKVSFKSERHITPISWSGLLGVVGIGLLVLARKMKPRPQ